MLFILACALPSWSRLLFVMGQGLQALKSTQLYNTFFFVLDCQIRVMSR